MKTSNLPRRLVHGVLALCALAAASAQAAVTLTPLVAGSAPAGTSAGGLNGNWYKLQNEARFSEELYTNENNETGAYKDFSWGTGIWSTADLAAIASGQNPYVTQTASSVGAISYANNIYNNTQNSGVYGTWQADYARALAPVIAGTNSCALQPEAESLAQCGGELNYAAVFSGYLYVAEAGTYDFGVFVDDGFTFRLSGSNDSLSMSHDLVAGSSGRDLFSLVDQTGIGELYLTQGYYGIDLSYFNRLEAGVIDLAWRGPGATAWTSVDDSVLHHDVPEPTTLALGGFALFALWSARRRQAAAAARQAR